MKNWIVIIAVVAQAICLAGSGLAQPFTRIVSPVQDQCLPGPDVTVKFEAGGMKLGPSAWNLHFKLDNEPFQIQYDGNHAHVFRNVQPGTHTVRVYAANAMQEAIRGTQSTVSFSVGYTDSANYVVPGHPSLTYNLPQGEYLGIDAKDVTVDFLVENAPLSPNTYQVAYIVDGRRFLVNDACGGPRHLKDLAPGAHRIRMELQDAHGDLVPGALNSEERVIMLSPDRLKKSPTAESDGYHNVPRLDSIKGSMTMGQSWIASEPIRPLTQEEVADQMSLTVHDHEGNTVRLDNGKKIDTDNEARVQSGAEVGVSPSSTAVGAFEVRQGGQSDEAATDLDAVDSSNVRRGSVVVQKEQDADAAENDGPAVDETKPKTTAADKEATSSVTTRKRADGTVSTVRRSTETLKLADKPGPRITEEKTSRTLRMTDQVSTATSDIKSTGSKEGKLGDRASKRSKKDAMDTSAPARRRERTRSRSQEVMNKKPMETPADVSNPQ